MKGIITLQEEITKIENDPQYIDFLYETISHNWGNNADRERLDELINYYQLKENDKYIAKLGLIRQENHGIHGELSDALEQGKWLRNTLEGKQEFGETIAISYYYSFVAAIYKGAFSEAVHYGNSGMEIAEKENLQHIHIKFLLDTATLYNLLREYECVEKIIEDISNMSFLLTERQLVHMALNKTAVYLQKGNIDEANKACNEACQYGEKLQNKIETLAEYSLSLCQRGYIFALRKLDMQAEKDFKEAIKIAKDNGLMLSYALAQLCYGAYELAHEHYEGAVTKLKEAMAYAEKMQSDYLIMVINKVFYKVYGKIGKWEKAAKALEQVQHYESFIFQNKSKLWMKHISAENLSIQLEHYKAMYRQMERVAKMGTSFTSQLSVEHLQQGIYNEISKLLELDFFGIAAVKNGKLIYEVFDARERKMDKDNDLVRYTQRLAEASVEFQKDIVINDGNFEEYSVKVITESRSKATLQSMLVNALKVDEHVIGAVTIGSYKSNCYTASDMNIAKIIASYLAISLKNASLYEEVRYLADHDALTGLMCRGVALKNGEELFKKNHKKGKNTGIIMFDADNFKQINDKYGHQLGDQVLKKIGEIMNEAVREGDYVGRYGGEEFIVILDNVTYQEVSKVAERIKTQLEACQFDTKKEKGIKVTLSGGIYICNEYTINFADAIRFADHALYRAKILGRNRIISYSFTQ